MPEKFEINVLTNKEDDDDDSETVAPDLDNSDNIGPTTMRSSTRNPAEKGKDGSQGINTNDCSHKLERREDIWGTRLLSQPSDDYTPVSVGS